MLRLHMTNVKMPFLLEVLKNVLVHPELYTWFHA